MKIYSIVYAKNKRQEVLLTSKNGKLNLVGEEIRDYGNAQLYTKQFFERKTGIKQDLYPILIGEIVSKEKRVLCMSYDTIEKSPEADFRYHNLDFYNLETILNTERIYPDLNIILPLLNHQILFLATNKTYTYPTLSLTLEIYG